MNRVRLLHTADWHFRPGPLLEETVRAASAVADLAREREVRAAVLAGDLFDRSLRLESEAARAAVDAVRRLVEAVPTLVLQGTPSHDVPGALDLLRRLALPGLTVMDTAGVVVLDGSGRFVEPSRAGDPSLVVAAFPEPTVASLEAGLGENPALALDEALTALLESGRRTAEESRVPLVLAAHGMVRGAVLPSGLPAPDDGPVLEREALALADYAALGHVHRFQTFDRAAYAGSLVPQDHTEREPHGVVVVEVAAGGEPSIEFVETPHTPVRVVEAADVPSLEPDAVRGARVRVELTVKEGESPIELERPIRERLAAMGAAEVTFRRRVEVRTRVRAEGISTARTMWDKLSAWAEARGVDLPDTARDDLALLEAAEDPDQAAARMLELLEGGRER